ncbi:unnamed protein product [Schistosoma rodhaini]|uniref:Cilia- and flagella-associated protein 44 n=1 Tax=Schistosoma rodhaini TaxID=6188 RepID=A0AA85G0P9_9TREM|nr:unnamed protein product [Schistosoma rodhaini]
MSDHEDNLDTNKQKEEDDIQLEDESSTVDHENQEEQGISRLDNEETINLTNKQEDISIIESSSSNEQERVPNSILTTTQQQDQSDDNNQTNLTQPFNEQSKKTMDPEFFYNYNDCIVHPLISENSGIPENLLKVTYLFGMDVVRRENLQLLEYNVICCIYGNYLLIMNIDTHQKIMIRSMYGIGIGTYCIQTKDKYIALAEKGDLPNVCIYQYPNIKLYRILRNGTQTAYTACQFSPDGELLATVGSNPDYTLTIWDWKNEQIILKSKAYSQDIYQIQWSNDLIGLLTTVGIGHIKFWQIANTFTGLKLQGKLGKFGKTELTDIEGFIILPDGKVLTGSIWGNLLIWDDDLIKVQITRKNKQTCHYGNIMQIIIDEGELITIGQDGWIRTWDFETIDTAESSEEGGIYELEPMNELRVGLKANLMHIVKIPLPDSTMWYAQDADGAIWKLDLSFSHTSLAPECLEEFHANDIADCVTSPSTYCAATVGLDGKVFIYDIVQQKVLVSRRFPSGGSSIIWSPPQVDPKGKILIVGHQDGVLRVIKFGENPEELTKRTKQFALLDLGQAIKPHTSAITSMIYSPSGKLFITGSKDETVFFFNVHNTHLSPIGFINVYGKVIRLEWFYINHKETNEIIVYLENGCVLTVECPTENEKFDHSKTFSLSNIKITKSYQLQSIKSRLDHDEDAANKLAEYKKAKENREEIRRINTRLQPETDEDKQKFDKAEEAIYQGVLSEIADWTPTYPSNPSPLLYGCLDRNEPNQFWVSLGDFDKGYLYKCELGGPLLTIDDAIERIHKTKEQSDKHYELHHIVTDVTDSDQSQDSTITSGEKGESLEKIDPYSITLTDRILPTEPNQAICITDKKDASITYWTFSNSGYRLLIGFNDGVICVQLLEKPFDLTKFKGYWMYRLHDNQRGCVNRIALTYDEKFLLSAGSDGTLFVCELMTEEMQDKEIKEYRARIPSTFDTSVKVDDIIDPKAYSIEETKQKSEHDRLVELAERKKTETRKKVAELKDRLKKLKEQNNRLPERIRLPTEAFNLVPQIRYDLFKDRQAEIDLVYKETAWETEKYKLALEKLEKTFIKPLDCDRITVKAFCSAHCVTSIRMNKLSEEHMKVYDEIMSIREKSMSEEKGETAKHSTQLDVTNTLEYESDKIKNVTNQVNVSIKGARGLRIAQKLNLLEESKRKRDVRRAQWKQLEAMRPADDYEDPRDIQEIQLAKEKIGDYKLKSATNYVIPESMKLNTSEVKHKLLNLVDHVFKLSHEFNVSLLELRNKKMKIIENLKKIDKQLDHINGNLPLNEYGIRLYIEELDDDEYPERKFIYNNEILMNFKDKLESNKQMEQTDFTTSTTMKKSSNRILSFTECILPEERYDWKEPKIMKEFCNTNNSSSNDVTNTIDVIWFPLHCLASDHYYITILKNTDQKYSLLKSSLCSMIDEMSISNNGTVEEDHQGNRQQDTDGRIKIPIVHPIRPDKINSYIMDKNNKIEDINLNEDNSINQSTTISSPSSLTSLEIEYNRQKHIKAIYYRNHLLQLASRFIRCFDIEVRLLRQKRSQLGVLLKRSELYQYTLYNEYCLLKEFEKSEYVLMEKMKNRLEEKQYITNKVNELTLKLEQKKKDLEHLSQREHQIHEEFKTSLDDSHKFIEFLTKVFKKRIKRKKQELLRSGNEDESEESTSSSSSSDDSSYEEMDDESENEDVIIMDLDTCPPGCPMEDFERTCLIREKRLDVEEEMTEEKKTLDILRKDLEIFTKKQRIVETTLKQAQNELEAFQLEKQRKLNELEIIVIIRLNQINHFVNDSVPSDMTNSLIFLKNNLHKLQKRIHELEIEQKQQRIERKQAKLHHLMLQKYKKLFQKEIEKLSTLCDKEMNDKFGRIDDIEKMENIMVNPKLEDLTTKMLVLQEEFAKEEAKIESKIRDVRDSCMEQIRQNTVYLKKLLTLFNENQQLQNDLNQINSTKIGTIQSSPGIVDHKQLKQLGQLVKLQSEEINSLTQEIQQLSR